MTLVKQRSIYLLTYWYTFFILLLTKLKILNFCVKLKTKKDFQIFEGANILERILGARHTSPKLVVLMNISMQKNLKDQLIPSRDFVDQRILLSPDYYFHAKKIKISTDSFYRY